MAMKQKKKRPKDKQQFTKKHHIKLKKIAEGTHQTTIILLSDPAPHLFWYS